MSASTTNAHAPPLDPDELNALLGREPQVQALRDALLDFERNKHDLATKRGIYVSGKTGVGKTVFVLHVLRSMGYDPLVFHAGDVRNKAAMEELTHQRMASRGAASLFAASANKAKSGNEADLQGLQSLQGRLALVMDEMDGMNHSDKGGINTLIRMLRPKRTKKQRTEDWTLNPVVCIGHHHVDKKSKELKKACVCIELPAPTPAQMEAVARRWIPGPADVATMACLFQQDLRKFCMFKRLLEATRANDPNTDTNKDWWRPLVSSMEGDDVRRLTRQLLSRPYAFAEHATTIHETDGIVVGMLWHENVADRVSLTDRASVRAYVRMIDNMCVGDALDRDLFQKQVSVFGEASSIVKTFHNNYLLFRQGGPSVRQAFGQDAQRRPDTNTDTNTEDIRFTKAPTKYSAEYNNRVFVQQLCMTLGMDRRTLLSAVHALRRQNLTYAEMCARLSDRGEVSKLDVQRLERFLDKYLLEHANADKEDEEDEVDDVGLGLGAGLGLDTGSAADLSAEG